MFEAKNAFIGALSIINKFTVFNIKFYADDVTKEDMSFGIFLLPVLGLLIGLASVIISALRLLYDPIFIGVLLLIYYCTITKSVNLIDTYKTLNIIIKSNNNFNNSFYAILSICIIGILYFVIFTVLSIRAIILMPMIGFCCLIIFSCIFRRNKENTYILRYCTKYHAVFAFVFSFILTLAISFKLTIALSFTYALGAYIINLIDRRVKKLPSTMEGFIIEASQIIFLLLCYLLKLV